jgi:hypothetical protein
MRDCSICGTPFAGHHNATMCSDECRRANRKRIQRAYHYRSYQPAKRVDKACEQCGLVYGAYKHSQRFCSALCARAARTQLFAATNRACYKCDAPVDVPPGRAGRAVCDDCRVDPRTNRHAMERRRRFRAYGITEAEYDAMLARQGGCCAICRTTDPSGGMKRRADWAIDHCHATGQVRGILCSACNLGIGQMGDDPARLQAAAAYLLARTEVAA